MSINKDQAQQLGEVVDVGKDAEWPWPCTTGGNVKWQSDLNRVASHQKLEPNSQMAWQTPCMGAEHIHQRARSWREIYVPVFAITKLGEIGKQNVVCHTKQYHWFLKRKDILTHAGTQMNSGNILLSQVSQSSAEKYKVILCIWVT